MAWSLDFGAWFQYDAGVYMVLLKSTFLQVLLCGQTDKMPNFK